MASNFSRGAVAVRREPRDDGGMPRLVRPRPDRQPTQIKAWRLHRGMTLEQLAERVQMSDGQISRIERGESPYTQDTIEALATVLGCTVPQLIKTAPEHAEADSPMTPEEQRQVAAFLRAIRLPKTGTHD